MDRVSTVGLDLAKSVFQLHGADEKGAVVFRKKLRRDRLLVFFSELPHCLVAMEACASAHHWAREIGKFGHEVRLIPPAYVKPFVKRNKIESTRVEYRAPDSACNPYLAFAVILAAGLKGIEQGYELPREAAANLFAMTPEELAAEQILSLPGSLNEAVADMEQSELMAETLGEHVFEWFIRNKRAEWASYKTHISQFELDRYLPLL